ncbi:SET domain-containing protein [Mycena olivaceomarginata]|nr:SET domain-containing protein [Mycena olivaceomarginata]
MIARKAGAAGLEFVNDVDDEEVPPGIGVLFPYVERSYLRIDSVPFSDIGIAEPKELLGCDCDSSHPACSNLGQCLCQVVLDNGPAYSKVNSFVALRCLTEIVECNSRCMCPPNCANRVAQIPRQIHIQIFKTDKRGWGARAPVSLLRGQVVGMYAGSVQPELHLRLTDVIRASYCFDIDINEDMDEARPDPAYSVDAYGCGNWTRFLNHSCCPNLQIISVVYETMPEACYCICDNRPYLVFVAKQDIPAYVELTFDYNPAQQEGWDLRKYKEKSKSKQIKIKNGKTPCLCGAAHCRGWLPVVA